MLMELIENQCDDAGTALKVRAVHCKSRSDASESMGVLTPEVCFRDQRN